jgi:hypothetical protein
MPNNWQCEVFACDTDPNIGLFCPAGCPAWPVQTDFSRRTYMLTCLGRPVPAVLFQWSFPWLILSWLPFTFVMFQMSRLFDPIVLSWQFCHDFPVQITLSYLPCPYHSLPVLPVLSRLTSRQICSGCPDQDVLSRLSCSDFLSLLSSQGCPTTVVQSQLPRPCCYVLACSLPVLSFLSWLSVPTVLSCCPVLAVLSWLFCLGSPVYLSCLCCHVLTILS